jgi:hypothetical protein
LVGAPLARMASSTSSESISSVVLMQIKSHRSYASSRVPEQIERDVQPRSA